MTLPSADELLTGVSKHAHGSVDGIEDSENKKIDWRAVGAGLRHYLPVVSALALAAALVGAGLMSDGCVEIVNVLHRHDIKVSYLFRYYLHTLFAVLTLVHITCFITLSLSWAAIATKSWVRAGWCLRRGTGCFVGFIFAAAWCTILAAVAIILLFSDHVRTSCNLMTIISPGDRPGGLSQVVENNV